MQDELESKKQQRDATASDLTTADEETALPRHRSQEQASMDGTELDTAPPSSTLGRFGSWGRRSGSGKNGEATPPSHLSPRLSELVQAFEQSEVAKKIAQDASQAAADGSGDGDSEENPDMPLQGYKRATLWTQFRILSSRAFKNLYRNPMLMLSHYALSAILGGASTIWLTCGART